MAKNTKTPVMILQELTVKKGYNPPNYELTYSEEGTHANTFHYRVCVQQQYATGIGRSKKEAKHDAAKKVLEMLSKEGIIEPEESKDLQDIQIDGTSVKSPVNCIPTLLELCNDHKIPPAEFIEISAVGQAHCREFTYECKIASITTRATAGSKKHAKQIAAKEMLERITTVIPELREEVTQLQILNGDDDVIREYDNLRVKFPQTNLNLQVNDSENEFKNLMRERGITREEVLKCFELPPNEDTLYKLLQLFDLKFSVEVLQDEPFMLVLHINNDSRFTLIEMGDNAVEIRSLLLKKVFEGLHVLMLEV